MSPSTARTLRETSPTPQAGAKSSFVRCTWPITGCLVAAEQMLGPRRVWNPVNEDQVAFLERHFGLCRDVPLDVVESMASFSAQEIMAWLAARSFPIEIEEYGGGEFGTASVLDVLLKWNEGAAERSKIIGVDRKTYDAVELKGYVPFFSVEGHADLVVELPNRDDHSHVFVTMLDTPPETEFGLIDLARRLAKSKRALGPKHPSVLFPMIHLEEQRNLEWILRMWTQNAKAGNLPAYIFQAIQMNRLRMNEEGVRAQSAAYMGMRTLSLPPQPYCIDRPFLFWIERDGVEEPLYTAWLGHDSWKDPGGLE